MAFRKSTRSLPRTPKINASTPLLKSAGMQAAVSATTAETVAAAGMMTPVSSQSEDATASIAPPPADPIPEQTISDVLSLELRNHILDAVKELVEVWRQLARFDNVAIHSIAALAGPNCLKGPRLYDLRNTSTAYHQTDGLEREVMNMALRGISDNFQLWQFFVTVPSLPMFPTFAAMPMPQVPPMPALPFPLSSFTSGQASKLTSATQIRTAIRDGAPNDFDAPGMAAFCDNIGQCCAIGFQNFLSSQVPRNLMGQGPVPSFNPPYVMVGPVIGGELIANAGMLIGSPAMSIPKLPLNI